MIKSLPIENYVDNIINLVINNNICIITGETGSGKSTKLPQILFDSEELKKKFNVNELNIIITQPRRVAAISMAKRVSEERDEKLFDKISYSIRFDDKTNENTKIRYVTDGILIRELLDKKKLFQYNIIILDEAHERSLFTDILFSIIKIKIKEEKKIKLIITSATLDLDKFSKFFNNCPILEIEGNCFQVEIFYNNKPFQNRIKEFVNKSWEIHMNEGIGDILCFLTGSYECEMCLSHCINQLKELKNKGIKIPGVAIFALYGAKNSKDQNLVFSCYDNKKIRKIIFSTNISETSLTIPNIGFVIDSGFIKVKKYSQKTGIDLLSIEPISKTQAIQRSGRAGRTQKGKCFRFYSEDFYENEMKAEIYPEILRINLSSIILSLKILKIDNILDFDLIDKPPKKNLIKGLEILFKLNCIDENENITKLGKKISKFPIDPNFSKVILLAKWFKIEDKILKVISILSSENIFLKFNDNNDKLNILYNITSKTGDFYTLIDIFNNYYNSKNKNEFCEKNNLNQRALNTSFNIYYQLKNISKNINLRRKYFKNNFLYNKIIKNKQYKYINYLDLISISFFSGFFLNICKRINLNEYIIINEGKKVYLDPFSSFYIHNNYPRYIIFLNIFGEDLSFCKIKFLIEIKEEYLNFLENFSNKNKFDLKVEESKNINNLNENIKNKNQLKEEKIKIAKEKLLKRKLNK